MSFAAFGQCFRPYKADLHTAKKFFARRGRFLRHKCAELHYLHYPFVTAGGRTSETTSSSQKLFARRISCSEALAKEKALLASQLKNRSLKTGNTKKPFQISKRVYRSIVSTLCFHSGQPIKRLRRRI